VAIGDSDWPLSLAANGGGTKAVRAACFSLVARFDLSEGFEILSRVQVARGGGHALETSASGTQLDLMSAWPSSA